MIVKLRKTVLVICLLISGYSVLAQPGDPGGDPDVPITGIELLIGAGAIFGARRAYNSFKIKR